MNKIEKEKIIVNQMIRLYCKKLHQGNELCEQCSSLSAYALDRLDMCPYGEDKKFCSKCPTHCYKEDMRNEIKKVMKYCGPRMMMYHPIMVIKHAIK